MIVKELLFRVCTLLLFLPAACIHAGDKISGGYTIENSVNTFSMDGIEPTGAGYQYWFADKRFIDGRTLKMSVVEPGKATHEPHTHAEDEFFFVLEGQAEFYLDGKTVVRGPYTSFYCPPGSKHGIRNAGDTELKYLVIKKYENTE
jgi:mannose-6-phosphate isomerase-like protein (cupin superfamily)